MRPSLLMTGFCLAAMALVAAQPALLATAKQEEADAGDRGQGNPARGGAQAYIERVRAQQAAEVRTPGSIWSAEGRLVRLGTDAKAVRLHDVVSIVVTESLAAYDRRAGEELARLQRQLRADRALRQAQDLEQRCRTCWA